MSGPERRRDLVNLPARPHRLVDPCRLQNLNRALLENLAVSGDGGDEIGNRITHGEYVCRISAATTTAFMPLPEIGAARHVSRAMETAAKIREWLMQTAEARGWSYALWANKARVAPSTVQRAVKPDYEFITSSRTLAKLADAAGVDHPSFDGFTNNQGERQEATLLPIRYEVGAGIWRSVDDTHASYGEGRVLADPAFAGFEQWMERVVTDSMDKEYPVGSLLHVVDSIGIGYAPRTGDHVIVERRQDGGLRERTVKEVSVTRRGLELVARSNNPRWDGPIAIVDGHDEAHCEVEIVGLVLGSYRSRRPS